MYGVKKLIIPLNIAATNNRGLFLSSITIFEPKNSPKNPDDLQSDEKFFLKKLVQHVGSYFFLNNINDLINQSFVIIN